MPFPFRRVDPRRAELEELRRQIIDLQNELAVLESTAGEEEPVDATPAPAAADIYQSVSRLRVTMVRREVRTKRQQLVELVQREKELAQTLKLPPSRSDARTAAAAPASPKPPAATSPNGKTAPAAASLATAPKSATLPNRARTPPVPESQKPLTKASTKREGTARKSSINLLNLAIAIGLVVIIFGLGLVLSGLLEIDPDKPYGFLSTVARIVQGATVGWIRPGSNPGY